MRPLTSTASRDCPSAVDDKPTGPSRWAALDGARQLSGLKPTGDLECVRECNCYVRQRGRSSWEGIRPAQGRDGGGRRVTTKDVCSRGSGAAVACLGESAGGVRAGNDVELIAGRCERRNEATGMDGPLATRRSGAGARPQMRRLGIRGI